MKTYVDKRTTRKAIAKLTCDICKRDAPVRDGEADWTHDAFDSIEIKIEASFSQGDGYGGGTGRAFEIDVCPECFEKRLVPWLKDQGSGRDWKEYDW